MADYYCVEIFHLFAGMQFALSLMVSKTMVRPLFRGRTDTRKIRGNFDGFGLRSGEGVTAFFGDIDMQIGAASSFMPTAASRSTTNTAASGASDDILSRFAPSKTNGPEAELLRFLKMTPAQKMQYQWLQSHKLSEQDLNAMSSEERGAIMKQMSVELAEKAKQNALAKDSGQGQQVNILA